MSLLWATFIWGIPQYVQSDQKWEWVTYAEVDGRGFGIKQDFIPLFFFMYS